MILSTKFPFPLALPFSRQSVELSLFAFPASPPSCPPPLCFLSPSLTFSIFSSFSHPAFTRILSPSCSISRRMLNSGDIIPWVRGNCFIARNNGPYSRVALISLFPRYLHFSEIARGRTEPPTHPLCIALRRMNAAPLASHGGQAECVRRAAEWSRFERDSFATSALYSDKCGKSIVRPETRRSRLQSQISDVLGRSIELARDSHRSAINDLCRHGKSSRGCLGYASNARLWLEYLSRERRRAFCGS